MVRFRTRDLAVRIGLEVGHVLARHEGRLLGFNLGSGWTDGTGVNENAIYVDGRLVKLGEDVRFHRDSTDPSAGEFKPSAVIRSSWCLRRCKSVWNALTCW